MSLNKNIEVSVITVCYNASSTLAQTIESVVSQQGVNAEHLIIDGGSSDGSQAIIERHRHSLAYSVSEPDDGLYHAMNKGVAKARGELVVFLNADDFYVTTDVLAQAVAAIRAHKVDACYADLDFVDAEDTERVRRRWRSRSHRAGLCYSGWIPAHPTFFIRREIFNRLGGFDTRIRFQSDLEFCVRAFEVLKISSVYVPQVWVKMRLGGVSTGSWRRTLGANWESFWALRRLGMKRDPLSYIVIKFMYKLPQFFYRDA